MSINFLNPSSDDFAEYGQKCVDWCKWYCEKYGVHHVILGISGGKDSTVASHILAHAIGAANVFGVLMPDGVQPDIDDSHKVVDGLGNPHGTIDISPVTDAVKKCVSSVKFCEGQNFNIGSQFALNMPPRVRMTILYAIAQSMPFKTFVVNTTNMSESHVGYGTIWGDTAGDIAPLANLPVEWVCGIGRWLGIDDALVGKVPSDGLSGISDEEKLGFSYADVYKHICERYDLVNGAETGLSDEVRIKIDKAHFNSEYKRKAIRIAKFPGILSL